MNTSSLRPTNMRGLCYVFNCQVHRSASHVRGAHTCSRSACVKQTMNNTRFAQMTLMSRSSFACIGCAQSKSRTCMNLSAAAATATTNEMAFTNASSPVPCAVPNHKWQTDENLPRIERVENENVSKIVIE